MGQVKILSGVSGSGKSTFGRGLRADLTVSADDFFVTSDNKYNFDPSKLGQAHAACFREYIHALTNLGDTLVVVDNTNTTESEISPYVLGASAFGWNVEIITISVPNTKEMVELCAKRNAHNVPANVIQAQMSRLVNRKLPPWWNHRTVSMVAHG